MSDLSRSILSFMNQAPQNPNVDSLEIHQGITPLERAVDPSSEVVAKWKKLVDFEKGKGGHNYQAIDYAMNLVAGIRTHTKASKERTKFLLTVEQIAKKGFLEGLHPSEEDLNELSKKIDDMMYLPYTVEESRGSGKYLVRKQLAKETAALLVKIINGASEEDFSAAVTASNKNILH